MDDLTIFIVQNQDLIWIFCAFIVFLFFTKFFFKLTILMFSIKKAFKITGRVK